MHCSFRTTMEHLYLTELEGRKIKSTVWFILFSLSSFERCVETSVQGWRDGGMVAARDSWPCDESGRTVHGGGGGSPPSTSSSAVQFSSGEADLLA